MLSLPGVRFSVTSGLPVWAQSLPATKIQRGIDPDDVRNCVDSVK
jgi:hypothetical protein